MMLKNDNEVPCKNCSYRTSDCHSTCPKYIDYQQKREVYKTFLAKEAAPYRQLNQYKYKQNSQYRHHKNRSKRG